MEEKNVLDFQTLLKLAIRINALVIKHKTTFHSSYWENSFFPFMYISNESKHFSKIFKSIANGENGRKKEIVQQPAVEVSKLWPENQKSNLKTEDRNVLGNQILLKYAIFNNVPVTTLIEDILNLSKVFFWQKCFI